MLVEGRRRQDSSPDAGASLPPLQLMERPPEDGQKRGGETDGMVSGPMLTCAGL